MLITIVLIWMAMQMQAPLWVYVLLVSNLTLQIINLILEIVLKVQEKQIEKEKELLRENLRKLGVSEKTTDELMDAVSAKDRK